MENNNGGQPQVQDPGPVQEVPLDELAKPNVCRIHKMIRCHQCNRRLTDLIVTVSAPDDFDFKGDHSLSDYLTTVEIK